MTDMEFKKIKSVDLLLQEDLTTKTVIVRVDFNVPVHNGQVTDDYRLQTAYPTVSALAKAGAKVVIISHAGDNKSLEPVASYFNRNFLATDWIPDLNTAGDEIKQKPAGAVMVIENLRFNEGEKRNTEEFGRLLAGWGDYYVNEAFSVCHREHASMVGIPQSLPAFGGYRLLAEIENLNKVLNTEAKTFLILGGLKFATKVPVLDKFLPKVEGVFIGGALVNSFLKARGLPVGHSIVEEDLSLLDAYKNETKIILPEEVEVETGSGQRITKAVTEVLADEVIGDIGQKAAAQAATLASQAEMVVWNGPLGNFESGFNKGTLTLAEKLTAKSDIFTVVGGGDTVAALVDYGLVDKFSFVSTGGGAMLDFLAQGNLPGLEVLMD
ncbi:MAG: phosphoglycerate kinase [Patescibacteria group bacterium]